MLPRWAYGVIGAMVVGILWLLWRAYGPEAVLAIGSGVAALAAGRAATSAKIAREAFEKNRQEIDKIAMGIIARKAEIENRADDAGTTADQERLNGWDDEWRSRPRPK